MANILGIGTSALLSLQQALNTTGHNIANVNTDGYSRQLTEFDTLIPQLSGGHYIGSGVQVATVQRAYDQFLADQVITRTSSLGYYDTYAGMATRVDDLLGDASTGLTGSLQKFFDSMQAVANNPGSVTEREILLAHAEDLAGKFQFLDKSLASLDAEASSRATVVVGEINDLASRIARLNVEMARASAASAGRPPNDLLDERDRLLGLLAEKTGISVMKQKNGTVDVMIGTGQPLVIGGNAQKLNVSPSASSPGQLEIGITGVNGTSVSVTNLITGGELQGLVDFRSRVIDPARNELGRVAFSLSETFNAQHRRGMDLNNAMGGNLFAVLNPTVVASGNNTGSASVAVSLNDVTALEATDYRMSYTGTQWRLTRLSDNTVTTGAGPFAIDGITITPSGSPAAGDTFLVRPVHDAAGQFAVKLFDARQIAAAVPVRSDVALANTGSGALSQLVVNSAAGLPLATPITLTFNPDALGSGVPGYDVSGGPAGPLAYNPATESGGKSFSLAGFGSLSFTLSGIPQAGDTITVVSNTGAAGDNRNALLLAGLQSKQQFSGGTASYAELYGQLVADVGVTTRQAQSGLETETLLKDRAISARDSVSGVNLEEEAANLLRFQQAYQAAAQVVATADELFQTLLNATGR